MERLVIGYLTHYFFLSPLIKLLGLFISYHRRPDENFLRGLVRIGGLIDFLHILLPLFLLEITTPLSLELENFCGIGWHFAVSWDFGSYVALIFSTITMGIVGQFSVFYLHRDVYLYKYFTLYFVFQLALALVIFSASTQNMFIGWELLGVSSVLLIAMYQHRVEPLKNSLRVLFIYKIGDLMLFALVVILGSVGIHEFSELGTANGGKTEWLLGFFMLACFIKSGVFPWYWLPRAMEGPTPSSAMFYGGLATHIPVLIMLKIWPSAWTASHPLHLIGIFICVLSAIFSTAMSRQASDAKNALAFAATTQLAIIYVEIFLGFRHLALIHCVSHGFYRTFEFLRAPSLLYLHHAMEQKLHGVDHPKKVSLLERFFSPAFRRKFYALSLLEFCIFPRQLHFIDDFLGIAKTQFTASSLRRYFTGVLFSWVVLDIALSFFETPKIEGVGIIGRDELFLVLALGFNVIARANINKPKHFLLATFLSVELILGVLTAKQIAVVEPYQWLFVALLVVFFGLTVMDRKNLGDIESFRAFYSRTPLTNNLILLIGLSIVAVPGLGNFFVWEFLVHSVTSLSPQLVIQAFFILSLNTILMFVFYYVNFLGQRERYRDLDMVGRESIAGLSIERAYVNPSEPHKKMGWQGLSTVFNSRKNLNRFQKVS